MLAIGQNRIWRGKRGMVTLSSLQQMGTFASVKPYCLRSFFHLSAQRYPPRMGSHGRRQPETRMVPVLNCQACGAVTSAARFRYIWYEDFAIIKRQRCGCPVSFNRLTPAWFLNESKTPNVRCDENYDFYTVREIATDEELTVDYSTFSQYPGGQTND
jgi:hypothetical protein